MHLERGNQRTVDIIPKTVTRPDQDGLCTADVLIPTWHIKDFPLRLSRIPAAMGDALMKGLGANVRVVLERENPKQGKSEGSPYENNYWWGLVRTAEADIDPVSAVGSQRQAAGDGAAPPTPPAGNGAGPPMTQYDQAEAIKRASIERQTALKAAVDYVHETNQGANEVVEIAKYFYAFIAGPPAAPVAPRAPEQPPVDPDLPF